MSIQENEFYELGEIVIFRIVENKSAFNNHMERKASRRKLLRGFRSCGRYVEKG